MNTKGIIAIKYTEQLNERNEKKPHTHIFDEYLF